MVDDFSRKHDIAQPVLSRWRAQSIDKVKEEYVAEKAFIVKKFGELTLDVDYKKSLDIVI